MKPLAPNSVLQNRYQINSLIGKGGMGEVYLAVDQRLGHSVALKRTTVGDDKMLADAFEREARTLAQLRHPVLPKVSDHFLENAEQFLIMEYISGEDLSKRLKTTKKAFPLNWVLFWADQLLEALNYLHNFNPPIIHRDIKPQNLKLSEDNQIVLLDFGLSKNSLGSTRVTSSGSVVGYTPHYAPMEQIRGTGTNPVSDIYSLSATLYQLLTNSVPPDALTRADNMLAGSPDPTTPLTELNKEISEELSDIILKGMDISQEKRYPTARDMQKALRKAYNQLQDSMSAETVAFNVNTTEFPADSVEAVAEPESIADMPTEVGQILPPPVVEDIPEQAEDVSLDKTEVIDAAQMQGIVGDDVVDPLSPNADVIEPPEEPSISEEPSVMETEMYSGGIDVDDSGSASYDVDDVSSLPVDDDFSDDASSSQEESFSPGATVPIGSFDDDNDGEISENESEFEEESLFEPTSEHVSDSDYGMTQSSDDDGDSEESDSPAVAAGSVSGAESSSKTPPPAAAKSSVGKYVAILGGLGLVLLLVIGGVAAVGYYVSNNGVTDTNIATPSPEQSIETTPEPTAELVDENSNSEDENTDTGEDSNSNTSGNTDEASNTSSEPEKLSTPEKTTGTSNPGPKPTRSATPRPTRPPVVKPTRTKTPRPPRPSTPAPTQKKPTSTPYIP